MQISVGLLHKCQHFLGACPNPSATHIGISQSSIPAYLPGALGIRSLAGVAALGGGLRQPLEGEVTGALLEGSRLHVGGLICLFFPCPSTPRTCYVGYCEPSETQYFGTWGARVLYLKTAPVTRKVCHVSCNLEEVPSSSSQPGATKAVLSGTKRVQVPNAASF